MKRARWILVPLGLGGIGIGLYLFMWRDRASGDDFADSPFTVVGKDSPRLETSELLDLDDERSAYAAVEKKNYIEAREVGEKLLSRDPDSPAGLYALAHVEAFGDGNLARGLFHVRRLRHRMEEKGRREPGDRVAREWYLRGLETEIEILANMDRRQEELRAIGILEASTGEPAPQRRIWPLVKLERYDEARAAARAALEAHPTRGEYERSVALNGLNATEYEARDRVAGYETGRVMVEEFPGSAVLRSNFALSAEVIFEFEEAEAEYARAAATRPQDFFAGTAWHYVARLQIQSGRFQEALQSLQRGREQRNSQDPYLLQQDEAYSIGLNSTLYLALGRSEAALGAARRACELPDRAGASSQAKEIGEILSWLLRRAAVLSRLEEFREEAGARGFGDDLRQFPEVGLLRLEELATRRRLLLLLEGKRLSEMLRPVLLGHSSAPPWLQATLALVLPPAVARQAAREARSAESHPGAAPYFDAQDAEIALALDEDEEALELARRARNLLPAATQKLLRGRLAAVAGMAARRLGREGRGKEDFALALDEFPEAFRLLGASLPVRIETDESDLAREVAAALRGSARLEEDPDGFAIRIELAGGELALRMDRGAGAGALVATVGSSGDEKDVVLAAVRRLHTVLAAGGKEIPDRELLALEGSPLPSSAERPEPGS